MRYSDEVIGIEVWFPYFCPDKAAKKAVKYRDAIGIYGWFTIGTLW
jgi:hypothetical protein